MNDDLRRALVQAMATSTHERRCGDCTLCCKLLPVRELGKVANQACKYQRSGKGCTVYHQPAQPFSCRVWSCMWLRNDDADDLWRPDRSHYVIDPSPDYVNLVHHHDGAVRRIDVVQIWVDPKHPNAHRDPALRAWIDRRAARLGHAAIVRFDSRRALHLFPPSLSSDGRWHERHGTSLEREHTTEQIMGGAR